ncbi:autotransporter outer membrane beta-barrel domain-containing protein [Azospirillum sp.]|uniref:autotransporter outer membrane beta-barrel domain-containing protein n=1 Tax=Azospirillum sp. TaxID=34012 RepID=UPI003D7370CA
MAIRTLAGTLAALALLAADPAGAAGAATATGIPGLTVLGTASAESMLTAFQGIYGTTEVNPPFELGTTAYVVRTTQPFVAVRSYVSPRDLPGKAGQTGGWVMPIAEMRGLTRAQILDRWALPVYGDGTRNNMMTLVVVPAGVSFWSGVAGPITNAVDGTGSWGQGGGIQYYVGWGAAGVQGYQVPAANYTVTGSADPGPVLVYGPRLSGPAKAVGSYLDSLPVAAYSDLDRALLTLDVLNLTSPADAAPLQAAVRQFGPEVYGALPHVLDHQRTLFLDALDRRGGRPEAALAPGLTVWTQALGSAARLGSTETMAGYRAVTWAGMSGVDYRVSEALAVGLGGGYLRSRLDWKDAGSSTGRVETALLGVHGTYTPGSVVLNGQVAGGTSWGDVGRRIAIADSGALPGVSTAIARTATGKPRADSVVTRLDLGTEVALESARVTPFVGLQHAWQHGRGFTESGADGLNLAVEGRDGHSLRSRAGIALAYPLAAGWTLGGRLLWSQRLSASSAAVSAGLAGQPGSFTIGTTGESPWSVQPALGLSGRFTGGRAYVRYEGDLRRNYRAHAAVAGAALAF